MMYLTLDQVSVDERTRLIKALQGDEEYDPHTELIERRVNNQNYEREEYQD